MASNERVRIEVAFEGGVAVGGFVPLGAAEELDRVLSAEAPGAFVLEAEDGRYTLVLRKVLYVKRFARESRVGFGA